MSETEVLEPTATVDETGTTDAAVPEAPEVHSGTGDEPVVTTEAATPARPRDAQGRFLKKDGSPVAPDEQAELLKAAAQSPATSTTPPAPKPSAPPAGDPFVFRADGQKIPIPGALLGSDGTLTIPANQVAAMRQLLAEGMAHRGTWRAKEADYQRQISESSAVEKARAEKYNAVSVLLFDRIMSDDWLIALAQDPAREREYLRRELGLSLRDADLNAPRASAPPKPATAQDDAPLEQAFGVALTEEVDDLLDDPQVKVLFSPEDRKELQAAFAARMPAFAAVIDGDLKLDLSKLKAEFGREVTMQRKIKQAALDAKKAKDFNDARTTSVAGVPVVSTKGPASTGTSTPRQFKTREEYHKAMGIN